MTSRPALGAQLQAGSHYGRDTQPDSNSFKQTLWDLFLISSAVVLGLSAAGAIIVFAILLFLCKF